MKDSQDRTMREILESFPDAGWWQKETFDAFYACAYQMEKAGWPNDLIEELLRGIYLALRKEYGVD